MYYMYVFFLHNQIAKIYKPMTIIRRSTIERIVPCSVKILKYYYYQK